MDNVRISGFGGIDIEQLVEAVMLTSKYRLEQMESRRAQLDTAKNAWGKLDSKLEALDDLLWSLRRGGNLGARQATSANEALLTASASNRAEPGSYRIEVRRLATAQIIMSDQVQTAEPLGLDGTVTINGTEITITAGMTLAGIRDAINQSGAGATATIIDGRLFLTGRTGAEGALALGDGGGVLRSLGILDDEGGIKHEQQAAADAEIVINGLVVTRSTNEITDLIDGVTLTLRSAEPGTVFDLTVAANRDADKQAIKDLVQRINEVLSLIRQQYSEGGALRGDASTLRMLETHVKQALMDEVPGAGVQFGFALGLTWGRDGLIQLSEAKLEEALSANQEGVRQFFLSEGGAVERLQRLADLYADIGGIFEHRQESLRLQQERMQQQIENARYLHARREELVRSQFIQMQRVMMQMQNMGSGFSSFLMWGPQE